MLHFVWERLQLATGQHSTGRQYKPTIMKGVVDVTNKKQFEVRVVLVNEEERLLIFIPPVDFLIKGLVYVFQYLFNNWAFRAPLVETRYVHISEVVSRSTGEALTGLTILRKDLLSLG